MKKLNKIQIIVLTTIVSPSVSFAQSIENTIQVQTDMIKRIALNVAIVAVIIGVIAGAIAIMWDFKDNKTLKQVLISIAVGLIAIGAIGGIVSYLKNQTW